MASPLTLYVAWHPRCAAGPALAADVFRWFHSPGDDLLRAGLGLPVFFRSAPRGPGQAPAPIDLQGAQTNVLLVLADEHMVSDPDWTAWLLQQVQGPGGALVVPVALHPAGYRLPAAISRLNYLRLDARLPPPMPPMPRAPAAAEPQSATPSGPTASPPDPTAGWAVSLRRQLTEVLARLVVQRLRETEGAPPPGPAAAPPPLTVFLSHAKRDGLAVAEALRDAIQQATRLQVFFDDNDLPVGHGFADALQQAAGRESAAMIAVVTDAYAARPWCRREVELARWPRPEPQRPDLWSNCPLLAVQQLAGTPTRHIPELGNATVVGWRAEQALDTVDLLLREVVLSGFHRLAARQVPPAPGRHVVSWAPDASSLLMLLRSATTPVHEVVYPGHALPGLERQALRQLFPGLALRTVEEVMRPPQAAGPVAAGRLVGLSLGYHDDLGLQGLGPAHFEEVALRLGRLVSECGGRMAFGGMLGSSGLTESLQQLARALTADADEAATGPSAAARIVSYQRWPSLPDARRIAEDKGIAEYVCIDNPLPPAQRIRHDRRIQSPERTRQDALTLSAMRLAMTHGGQPTMDGQRAPRPDARIFMGGLRTGFNGFMPGLFEEALYALEAGQPVFLLGGFGGATALLAQAVHQGQLAPEFGHGHHLQAGSRFALLWQGLSPTDRQAEVEDRFERLRTALVRAHMQPSQALGNGLADDENQRLMASDHLVEVLDLLRLGFTRLWGTP